MAQAFDEPLVVVGLDEGGDALSEVIDIVEEPGPEALLLDGPQFCHSVALRLTDEGSVVFDAQPGQRPLEVPGSVWAAPVVAELDPLAISEPRVPKRSMTAS